MRFNSVNQLSAFIEDFARNFVLTVRNPIGAFSTLTKLVTLSREVLYLSRFVSAVFRIHF